MKKVYHINVPDPEKDDVPKALEHLGVHNDDKEHGIGPFPAGANYVVSLSKYELLYLRLACRAGTVKNITKLLKKPEPKKVV